ASCAEVRGRLQDWQKVQDFFHSLTEEAKLARVGKETHDNLRPTLGKTEPISFLKEVQLLSSKVVRSLTHDDTKSCLGYMGHARMTLRCFLSVALPFLTPAQVEACLAWFLTFEAIKTMEHILGDSALGNISASEIEGLFKVIDADGDGNISVQEVAQQCNFSQSEAKELIAMFDK
ncbi:unnamed protein product, partial [Polarella glacialis]